MPGWVESCLLRLAFGSAFWRLRHNRKRRPIGSQATRALPVDKLHFEKPFVPIHVHQHRHRPAISSTHFPLKGQVAMPFVVWPLVTGQLDEQEVAVADNPCDLEIVTQALAVPRR